MISLKKVTLYISASYDENPKVKLTLFIEWPIDKAKNLKLYIWRNFRGIIAKELVCYLEVYEFKLQSRYYVHFWTNTLKESINTLISRPAMG